MAQRFDWDGNYSGVECTNNDIQLNIVGSATPGANATQIFLHSFILNNRLIRISC